MSDRKDQIDAIHDILAENDAFAVYQAHMEGLLDGPLARVIETMGRGDAEFDPTRVAMVLNYAGRTLSDAYGRETYRKGLMLAHTDLYCEGSKAGMEQVLESAREGAAKMTAAVDEALEKALANFSKHLVHAELRGNATGVATGILFSAGMVAFAWWRGVVAFL